jgi:hypothetical protein
MGINDDYDYVVVIDTDQYAGNFEREMCAYLTGQVGECGVGEEIAEAAAGSIEHLSWWEDNVASLPDEHGCHRPVAMMQTAGLASDGKGGVVEREMSDVDYALRGVWQSVGIFLESEPPQEVMDELRRRATEFAAKRPDQRSGGDRQPLEIRTVRLAGTHLSTAPKP